VKTLGYDNIHTLLLTAPPYVLAVFTTFLNAWHADKTGERFWHIVLPLCVGVAAFILAACTHSTAPRYVAMMLMVPGVYTGYVVALAWISNSMPRPRVICIRNPRVVLSQTLRYHSLSIAQQLVWRSS
jgi:hypothetical protein